MKFQKGFTMIELLLTISIFAVGVVILIGSKKTEQNDNNAYKQNNYNDYNSQCIKGHKFIVTKNGDLRKLLDNNQQPIMCELETENISNQVNSNIKVDANPYKNQE